MTQAQKLPKIYLVSQDVNDDYDTYNDFVCATSSTKEARHMRPDGNNTIYYRDGKAYSIQKDGEEREEYYDSWCDPKYVKVKLIGHAKPGMKEGVVCASFHAG